MDELVRHCLNELAFDGDLGCKIQRLFDFVNDFHSTRAQNVDDRYKTFVWSLVVRQPTVKVGVVPVDGSIEVYVPRKARHQKTEGEEDVDAVPPTLEEIPDAASMSLADLMARYGESLRVAVDPETSFATITGSHVRSSKLTPMVYACLQLISRARDDGISVVDLGKKTRYDQKTCFYLVKILVGLDLIVKLKRGGNSHNFCVHKFFFDKSPLWQKIKLEETGFHIDQSAPQPEVDDEDLGEPDEIDPEPEPDQHSKIQFEPIDSRHLSSLPLLRSRLTELVESTPDKIYPYNNLIVAIGFENPVRSDRRFFQRRLRELLKEGTFEKVLITSPAQRGTNGKLCLRLAHKSTGASENVYSVQPQDLSDDGMEDLRDIEASPEGLKFNVTVQMQIVDLIESTGTAGTTMNDIFENLNSFSKRTLELMLTRMEKNHPSSNLLDLRIVRVVEMFGRERRHRYYTLANYQTLVAQEGLDGGAYSDLSRTGGFLEIDDAQFYNTHEDYVKFVNSCGPSLVSKTPKRNQKKEYKNPILPDGTRKKGRPLKVKRGVKRTREADDTEESSTLNGEGKSAENVEIDELESEEQDQPVEKRRGPKKKHKVDKGNQNAVEVIEIDELESEEPDETRIKKRGRPKKKRKIETTTGDDAKHLSGAVEEEVLAIRDGNNRPEEDDTVDLPPNPPVAARKRGRPRKTQRVRRNLDSDKTTGDNAVHEEKNFEALREEEEEEEEEEGLQQNAKGLLSNVQLDAHPRGKTDSIAGNRGIYRSERSEDAFADVSVGYGKETGTKSGPRRREAEGHPNSVSEMIQDFTTMEASADTAFPTEANDSSATPMATRRSGRIRKPTARATDTTVKARIIKKSRFLKGQQSTPDADISLLTDKVPDDEREHDTPVNEDDVVEADAVDSEKQHTSSHHLDQAMPVLVQHQIDPDIDNIATASSSIRDLPGKVSSEVPSSSRKQPNISQRRRENEILRVIENMGGIANTSGKDFIDAHVRLLDDMTKAGEATSAPAGTRLDRRTLETALSNLQSRHMVKMVTTSIRPPMGAVRPVKIAFLHDVEQSTLDEFLSNLDQKYVIPQTASVNSVELPDVYHRLTQLQSRPSNLESSQANRTATRMIPKGDNNNELRNEMLTDRQTVAQLYGFIVGKAMRARSLHLATLQRFEDSDPSSFIVSVQSKVIDFNLYFKDFLLDDYLSVVSVLHPDDELEELLAGEEGRRKHLRDLPEALSRRLQIGRSRSRVKIFEILELLLSLGVVRALEETEAHEADLICSGQGVSPSRFNYIKPGPKSLSASSFPRFWQICSRAPLHVWSISEDFPPFYKSMPSDTVSDSDRYWEELREVCIGKKVNYVLPAEAVNLECIYRLREAAGTLKRAISWENAYVLSESQRRYLKSCVNIITGDTPLQGNDQTQIQSLSRNICAPVDAIVLYFESSRQKFKKQLEKLDEKRRQVNKETTQKSLENEDTEAKARRILQWDKLVQDASLGPLEGAAVSRVKQLRKKFLEGTLSKTEQEWLDEILGVVNKSRKLKNATKSLPKVQRTESIRSSVPHFTPENEVENFIQNLINQQLALGELRGRPPNRRRKGKDRDKDDAASKPQTPRHRFHWTQEYDELAIDLLAIVKARCRTHSRFDWAAFDQAFPGVPRNSVRQRVAKFKEISGHEAYVKRLEDKWHELWLQHRGSGNLPDENPQSPSNFSVLKHVAFLRSRINKAVLRKGQELTRVEPTSIIPSDVEEILQIFDVTEPDFNVSREFMWNIGSDESRIKQNLKEAFTVSSAFVEEDEVLEEPIYIAEAALKMAFGTPNEHYDAKKASDLLHAVGEQRVSVALNNLLKRGVISKLIRDPAKDAPGRRYKISEINQAAMSGPIPRDTYLDASQLQESYSEILRESWQSWSYVSTDGDTAALLQFISDDNIDFDFDAAHAKNARHNLDWNSKKAADDDIELGIRIRARNSLLLVDDTAVGKGSDIESPQPSVMESQIELGMDHGLNSMGNPATCATYSEGPVDCRACLQESREQLFSIMKDEECQLASQILQIVYESGTSGITSQSVIERILSSASVSYDEDEYHDIKRALSVLMKRLRNGPVPLMFWAGYTSNRLVSYDFAYKWSITLNGDDGSLVRVFPRRWLDISGRRIADFWGAALKAIISTVLTRPGISLTELRWRLKNSCDRRELNEILDTLSSGGTLIHRHTIPSLAAFGEIDEYDAINEDVIYWFINPKKRWFRINSYSKDDT